LREPSFHLTVIWLTTTDEDCSLNGMCFYQPRYLHCRQNSCPTYWTVIQPIKKKSKRNTF